MKKIKNKGAFAASAFFVLVIIPWLLFTQVNEPGSKHAYEEGVVDVAFTWGDKSEDIQDFYNPLREAIGAEIVVESRLRENDVEKLLSSDSPPDLLVLSSNEMVQSYIDRGWIKPLDEVINDSGIAISDFFDIVWEQCKDVNDLYACIPWGADLSALFWNKTMFVAAGLDPNSPPATIEELREIAEKLTVFDADSGEIQQIGFLPDFPRSHMDLYVRMFGDTWIAEDGSTVSVNSQSLADAIQWESGITHSYDLVALNDFVAGINKYRNSNHPSYAGRILNCQQCHRTQPGNSEKMADQAFYNNQIAMMVDGQWQNGEDYIPTYAPEMEYGVAPLPAPEAYPNQANTSLVQGPVIVFPSGAKDHVLAAELIAWMLSPEFSAEAALQFGFLPIHKEASRDPRFQEQSFFGVFISLLDNENAKSVVPSELSVDLNSNLRKIEKTILYDEISEEEYFLNLQKVYSIPTEN